MNARHPSAPRSRRAWLAAPLLAAVLAGCAAPGAGTADAQPASPAPQAAAALSAPLIAPPPASVGTWVDLGHVLAPWLSGDAPVPVNGVASPTRVAGLRGSDGQWLAIVVAQVAPAGGAACPQPTSLSLDGGVRDACLRLRRDADFDRWLEKQHPVLYRWVEERQWGGRPRAWVSYRAPAGGGQAIETHAFVNPALLEASTRNNADFLAAGQPGVAWAQRFAAATRAAGAGGALNVPPFPYGPPAPLPPAPPAAAEPPPAPTQALQVTPPPRPPVQAPRRDRE
ncbi:MAG: hypothetical protein QM772_11370 [Ottowia sp.]|uniref:hypothetical protein n=1 Tax=Ottowia sp. TaxID=1898956 RepID=UPI0039E4D319